MDIVYDWYSRGCRYTSPQLILQECIDGLKSIHLFHVENR